MMKKKKLYYIQYHVSIYAYHGYSFLKIKTNNTCSFQLEKIMHINIEYQYYEVDQRVTFTNTVIYEVDAEFTIKI